jgi:hypothetical protein
MVVIGTYGVISAILIYIRVLDRYFKATILSLCTLPCMFLHSGTPPNCGDGFPNHGVEHS